MERRYTSQSGSDADPSSPDIWQGLSEIRTKFRQRQRQKAKQAAVHNLAKVSQALDAKLRQRDTSRSFSPLRVTDWQAPPVRMQNNMKGVNRTLLGEPIPYKELLPPYKAWSYLVRNELAHGVGRQMYYTDDIGETIPLSDTDEDNDSDTELLDGIRRHENMHILRQAVSTYGVTPEVVEAVARMLKCSEESVKDRMQTIAPAVPSHTASTRDNQMLDVMVANFTNSFCRRCKVYNCFTHSGAHIKPNQRRPSAVQHANTQPCGTSCYKLNPTQAQVTEPEAPQPDSDVQQTGESSEPARAKPDRAAPDVAAMDAAAPDSPAPARAAPRSLAPARAMPNQAAPGMAGPSGAAANSPAPARPERQGPLSAEPAASSSNKSSSRGPALTGTVWHSLQAFVQGHLIGGRKRTHSQAFEEPPATADTAAHVGAEASQHAKSDKQVSDALPTTSNMSPQAAPVTAQQPTRDTPATADTVDLTITSSDSEGPGALHNNMLLSQANRFRAKPDVRSAPQGVKGTPLSSKKKQGRRMSGAGSDPVEIDFTTSEDTGKTGHAAGASEQQGADAHGATSVTQSGQQLYSDAGCSPLKTEPSKSLRPLTALPQQMSIEGISATSGRDDTQGVEATAAGDKHPDEGWTPFEVSMFDKAAEMFTGEGCRMARLVGTKTCQEVHARLQKVGLPAALAGAANMSPKDGEARGMSRRAGAHKRPKMKYAGQAKHVVMKRLANAKGKKPTPPYQPCQCKGGCKEGCPCTAQGHFCEKFCACGPECESRFKGCVCKGGCSSRRCPCVAADRECDPDLCKPCQWTICSHKPPGSTDCQNMALRMRQHKRVAMGLSHVAGWGAFAQEDIRKNEFVAEYTGELIDHCEADRRGKAYDRDSNTYLFDLNDEWVIDAKQRGNKMRFANHSDEPNCRVQIKMVDGDHRVAIYAAKDIAAGTELLYNYGDKFGAV